MCEADIAVVALEKTSFEHTALGRSHILEEAARTVEISKSPNPFADKEIHG